ncbi:MAG: hypothetical protein NT062_08545 [Proteobacteria bacterium]|nr:hypothetical protein [Pseudomonadota bacterium]
MADDPTTAPPKLLVERFADGGIACLKFTGMIDESFDGKQLGASIACETLVLDLGGVKKISSFGIREWVDFMAAATKAATRATILVECAPKVVDQLNMVANFAGAARVFSCYAPFRCDYCDSEHRVLLQIDRDLEAIRSMKLAERPCPSCHEGMYFDDDGATFFSYLIAQDKFALEPEVATFLAAKLDYAVAGARKLRVDKAIEGRVTFVRLAGDLDQAFPRDKLAEGLEGVVILDVSAIGKIEPAGAAAWRSFLQMITPGVEELYLFGVQPAFLEKLCGAEDLGKKAQVLSFALPYTCKACGTSAAQPLDVGAHVEVLKFATAPELRCPTCKAAMLCTATDASMALLPGLPKPTASPALVASLGGLRERALAISKPRRATAPPATTAAGSSPWAKIAVVLGLAVVALGGVVAYKVLAGGAPPDKGLFGVGPVVERSAPTRPAWVVPGKLGLGGAEARRLPGGDLLGTAVSSIATSQQDAEDEAQEAALDAIAAELARAANDATWFAMVPSIYEPARASKLAALARDPQSTQARKDVREARQVTAYRLRNDGALPAIVGKYRETYDSVEGRRYVAFVQISMFADNIADLAKHYTKTQTVLGATIVPMYPLVGWRYALDHGAIVIGLAPGPLKDLGIVERNILVTVNGRDPANGIASFAAIATEEYTSTAKRGGTFRLEVQAGDGAKREFSTQLVAPPSTPPTPDKPTGRDAPTVPATGVNTWDRYGGNNKGSGRDDPTQ